ncbi:glycoside hydrolase family 26 protein [Aquimarina latercula]|uniref:glycoside hydrolase family 26 protein n=1 Tax=Aquimarina latercula TaxID=987 RepID=UPI0004147A2B|nr:glycosyl hydrolase [Aquimarina latercula]
MIYTKKIHFDNYLLPIFYLSVLLFFCSCKSVNNLSQSHLLLVDSNAKSQVHTLYNKIKSITKKGYAFGHQDATAYGIGWKNNGSIYKSDVNLVAGDFPGVYGFDIGHIETKQPHNLDTVDFKLMKKLILKAHKDNGIITLSWHPNNPKTNKSSWDTTSTVKDILKGGILHSKYKEEYLKNVAKYLKQLNKFLGKDVPVVFRPFHEMNGWWFWWGNKSCTPDEYKRLWRETVTLLIKEYNVHNVLFMYSPNLLNKGQQFLDYYPGDKYVDLLGIDLYQYSSDEDYANTLKKDLAILKKIGNEKNMPYALSEAGLDGLNSSDDWWTNVLDKNIKDSGISWVLLWRNARKSHFYVPYKNQKTSSNFIQYQKLPHVLFLNDLKKIK